MDYKKLEGKIREGAIRELGQEEIEYDPDNPDYERDIKEE